MTASINHQFLEFSHVVKKRYVKAHLEPLTGYRLNPRNSVNPNERIDWLLATPETNVEITPWEEGKPTQVRQIAFSYEHEVLELYTDTEVIAFERMNRLLIENGLLIEFSEEAPDINKVNALTDNEIKRIALIQSASALRLKIDTITSVTTLQTILNAMEAIEDIKYTHIKIVKAKIDELNTRKDQ